ncbi:hypothetical protein D3C78_691400 [compost metagenome]
MANRSQGFGRVIELFLFRRVENRDRRQGAFHGAVDEQRRLLLFLDAFARCGGLWRRGRNHRRHLLLALGHVLAQGLLTLDQAFLDLGLLTLVGDAWRDHFIHTVVDFTQLGNQLFALGTGRPPAIGGALEQFEQVEGDLAGDVHDLEPRQVGEHGQAEQEQGNEHQRAALHVQQVARQVAQALAQCTTGGERHACRRMEMDMCQRRTGQHQEHQADQPPGEQPAAPVPGLVAFAEDLPGLYRQQQREDVGEIPQHHEQDVGEVGTGTPGGVLHLVDVAGVAEARVGRIVGQQRHPQVQAQGADSDQRTFLEAIMQLLPPQGDGQGSWSCGGFLQNASIPARAARPIVIGRRCGQ